MADVLAQVRLQRRQGERRADLLAGLAVAAVVLLVCLWMPAGRVAG